ncbi:hypothetical protein ABLE91_25750 [Aquabacter sp. CN5-332]|uniref:hypothetical protein n=1 Tax=Aquabacter sp. CN5-332 TaxID=3156608 RepID=UPI0032B5FDC7
MVITNTGSLTMTPGGQNPVAGAIYGLSAAMYGGKDNPGGNTYVSASPLPTPLTITNSGPIAINLQGFGIWGGTALYALAQGGDGNGGNPLGGGSSGGASITNSGPISASVGVQYQYSGIEALALGGNGASNGSAGSGGNSGTSTVVNSAPVNVNLTWQNPISNWGVYGVLAQSVGGNGAVSNGTGNGGDGGFGFAAAVTLTAGGNVSVVENGTPPTAAFSPSPSAGVAAAIVGGNGGQGASGESVSGGNGGYVSAAQITVTDANVTTSGNLLPGLLVHELGGAGGLGGDPNCSLTCQSYQNGGNGGAAGPGNGNNAATIQVTTATLPVTISTAGTSSPAIVALVQGGAGGAGGYANALGSTTGGNGGAGGSINGPISIQLTGSAQNPLNLTTSGNTSPGISALSAGGAGGDGGWAQRDGHDTVGGNGGSGGPGGDITVSLASTSITTSGTTSPGIVAQSQGGMGGEGGEANGGLGSGTGGNGGAGGSAGSVTVTLDAASSINTSETDSSGIVAQSLSGAGGNSFGAGGTATWGGNGGAGGSAGNVTVENSGSISTNGATARGILAQSMAGTGGSGGSTGIGFYSNGGSGASSGQTGQVNVGNVGSITTVGANAEGILAQSIGGPGGAGGQASGFVAVGGSATTNPLAADGNTVSVNNYGNITTSGLSAIAVLGQSIGGGGGDGGGASGVEVSVGGSGGAGGSGGSVSGGFNTGSSITTSGDVSPAIVMQSIGGGGGNAGNASSNGLFTSVSVGGSGGSGGNGGSVNLISFFSAITTIGSKSPGVVAQSIGGGGGAGGAAFAGSVGAGFSAAVGIGGSGGTAGNGGSVAYTLQGGSIATGQNPLLMYGNAGGTPCPSLPCNLLPVDDFGVLVQSIGGGGGLGGSAMAQAVAVSIPVSEAGDQIAVAASVAMGGSGGAGGAGGAAQFALSNGGTITTMGQGSTGVLVQSIGGGGGTGGDSSSVAAAVGYGQTLPEGAKSLSLTVAFAMGGNGGAGGSGDTVNLALGGTVVNGSFSQDPSGSAPTSIVTYGDFADGALLQSIGGGGGNAGFGSTNTQAFGSGNNTSVSVTLGSTGGTGGNGGDIWAYLFAGNGITTYGSGAIGIVAQSIGGGGGASQGGSVSAGQTFSVGNNSFRPGVKIGLGTTGGTGGDGGNVTVSAQAPITTHGGDATGILIQSIGGGGGLGGSAGSDASADNPVVAALAAREAQSNIQSYFQGSPGVSVDATFSFAIGGQGGTGGNGNSIWAGLYAPITTSGDWASGVVAQSIGGGGGKGGSAAASGTGGLPEVTINVDMAVGGQGGTAGNGGPVTIYLGQGNQGGSWDNNTSITTAGFGAAGIIAQSVGGGGGIGADGSDSATGLLSVGGTLGSSGGSAGNGGTVTLNYYNPDTTTITTIGQAADGVILQSIGGGGGAAGAGSSLFGGAFKQSGTLTLNAGGSAGAGGAGGAVTFAPSSGSDTPLVISTTGNNSFGILAQSIGGGGGLVISQPSSTTSPSLTIGGGTWFDAPNNYGGAVTVTLGSQSTITTAGIGAHGVVAQSIGGGGGVIRLVDLSGDTPALTTDLSSIAKSIPGNGMGGDVTVEADGSIAVTGAGAVGILAQSVGAGGGLIANGNTIYAGSPNLYASGSSGQGGAVTVTTNGPVSSTGANGIGIFAQSTGYTAHANGQVSVTVNGSVMGGSGTAATPTQPGSSAIQIDSGSGNQVTVNSGGSLNTMSGTSGTAIVQTGGGTTNVTNSGTVTGAIYLGGGTFTNTSSGVHNTGAGAQDNVVNHGVMNIGLPQELRATRITGNFTQTGSGQLGVTIHSLLKAADQLDIDGAASIGGVIVPTAITLLPGTVPVVTARSLASTADAQDSLLFRWDASQSGNALSITPNSTFTPAGVPLNRSQASLANYFSEAWANADTAFAGQFASMSQITTSQQYTVMLNAFSAQDIEAQSIALANNAGAILGASMSCPVFVDQSVLLSEDNCAWATITGRWTNQGTTNSTQGYNVTTAGYRIGGQHEVAPNWYLGGSLAYGDTSANMDGGSTGDGYTVDGSLALKHTMGPWYFAGSVALAYGSYDTYRAINLPGLTQVLESNPSIFLAGARLRAGYEFTFGDWYLRPYGDLDVVYTDLPAVQESGTSLYALNVQGSSQTSVALSAMMEFGGRVNLDRETTLRPYVSFGVSYLPENTRAIASSFANETVNNGTFVDYIETPEFLGRIDLGLQVYRANGFELKVGYTADIGNSYLSQSANARFAYHF